MPDNRRELIKYRLESARERSNSAEVLLASKSYKDSIGRSILFFEGRIVPGFCIGILHIEFFSEGFLGIV